MRVAKPSIGENGSNHNIITSPPIVPCRSLGLNIRSFDGVTGRSKITFDGVTGRSNITFDGVTGRSKITLTELLGGPR